MKVADIEIELVQKDIKNLHLAVYPPDGRVRLAAPLDVNEKTLELFVAAKLPWIRKQQRHFAQQRRELQRAYVNRETHYFLGRRYLLRVHETGHSYRTPRIQLKNKTYIDLYVLPETSTEQKAACMKAWYRTQLKQVLQELIPKWEQLLGVKASAVSISTMRTKWGSCNTENQRILFNLELAKKPLEAIEYVVAHELTHLLERRHNDIFIAHLDAHLPRWRQIREELNALPI